ncbi:MAG: YceI family protein [Deltaproteobacteria bacterium]|nr:YceI family protein [Deltaproteobacteria bacterium]
MISLRAALLALVVAACGGSKAPVPEPPASAPPPQSAPAPATPAPPAPPLPAPTEPEPSEVAGRPSGSHGRLVLRRDGADGGPLVAQCQLLVAQGSLEPAAPEEARLMLVLELGTLGTGDPEVDVIVKGPDFLDVAKNALATVTLNALTPAATADAFTATATLTLRGVAKDAPLSLRVVEKRGDGTLVVEGEALGLARADFELGATPKGLALDATFDLTLRAELPPQATAPAKGTPDEVFAKMARHQGAVLDLIEAHKADPEAAADALEAYVELNKKELASIALALNRLSPVQLDALLATHEAALKGVMARGARVMGDNPGLQQSERFRRAMDALGATGAAK